MGQPLSGLEDCNAYEVKIHFDPTYMEFNNFVPTGSLSGALVLPHAWKEGVFTQACGRIGVNGSEAGFGSIGTLFFEILEGSPELVELKLVGLTLGGRGGKTWETDTRDQKVSIKVIRE